MHGRQKVERSAEEEQKKEKERAKKLTAYNSAMQLIYTKRGDNSPELLKTVAQVLAANPDIHTLWGIRKEALTFFKTHEPATFSEAVKKDYELTEVCLRSNPKSYGAWHHRLWLTRETDFERVTDELKLCAKFLQFDDRNFHCWDYRRYLLDHSSSMSVKEELDFTTEKIQTNFSNYSSWHLRSTLLLRKSENFLAEELDLIKNAAFTDPNDQSVWFYHRWLIMSQLPKETPKLLFAHHGEPKGSPALLCVFNIPVENPSELSMTLNDGILNFSDQVQIPSNWSNPWNISRSKLWVFDMTDLAPPPSALFECCPEFPKYFDNETQPKNPELEATLRSELEWVTELNEVEPDNKWIIATLILLMRLLNFREFKAEIQDHVKKLIELDPQRTNYYLDLRSKYTMEWKLVDLPSRTEEIDLSNLGLTSVYYLERLCAVKGINLSGNQLNDTVSLSALLMCERLTLQK